METAKEYNGYFCSVAEAKTIVIRGSICGLKIISQIHQWAVNDRISKFLKEKVGIENVPCYYWLLCLFKLIKPESLNRCFIRWTESVLPEKKNGIVIDLDGKTILSTGHMDSYENPLHVVSAQLSELGITFAQKSVNRKSNEILAVRKFIEQFEIGGCMVVTDELPEENSTSRLWRGMRLSAVRKGQ